MKERRAGATMGAPRGCPGAPCAPLLRRQRGRTKAVATAGRLWGRAGRWGLSGPGIVESLPSVLRSCAFGAAPVLRTGSFSRPARGPSSLRSRPERGTLRQIGSFKLSSGLRSSNLFGDGQESPWCLLNLYAPGVTSGFLPGVTSPAEWNWRLESPQGLQRAPSGPSPGTSWVGGGSALPSADVRVRFPPR